MYLIPTLIVRAASTAALPAHTSSGPYLTGSGALPAHDGVTLAVDDLVLEKDQGGGSGYENGMYIVQALNPWKLRRHGNMNESEEIRRGALVYVDEGTVNADTVWKLPANRARVMGVTNDVTFEEVTTGGASVTPSDANPAAIGTAAPGTSDDYSRADHVHAHGNQLGGALHANAIAAGAAGFMSGADKTKLDGIAASAAALTAVAPADVGTAAVGVATVAARGDHVHAHGNQLGGALHANAGAAAGFMSAADKTKLDGIAAGATAFAGTIAGQFSRTPALAPAQITSNQNNYNPAGLLTSSVVHLDTDALRTLTGIAAGSAGQILTVVNVGANRIFFEQESASSTAANRFAFFTALGPKASCTIQYNTTLARWVAVQLPPMVQLRWGATTTGNSTAARFLNFGATIGAAATEATSFFTAGPKAGVCVGFHASFCGAALAAANDDVFTFRVNGVDSAVAVTIPATLVESSVNWTPLAVAKTDYLSVKSVTVAASASGVVPCFTCFFIPDP